MYKFIVDLEFTGLDPITNDVIEMAVIVVNEENEVVDKFHSNMAPEIINEKTWDIKAQEIHAITPSEARRFPNRRDVAISFLHFLVPYKDEKNFPREFICHALPDKFFDKKTKKWSWPYIDYFFLEWVFRKENLHFSFFKVFSQGKLTSTIKMAREFTGERRGHKLNIWAKRLGIELKHHEAMSDAMACLEIYKYLSSKKECLDLGNINPTESS